MHRGGGLASPCSMCSLVYLPVRAVDGSDLGCNVMSLQKSKWGRWWWWWGGGGGRGPKASSLIHTYIYVSMIEKETITQHQYSTFRLSTDGLNSSSSSFSFLSTVDSSIAPHNQPLLVALLWLNLAPIIRTSMTITVAIFPVFRCAIGGISLGGALRYCQDGVPAVERGNASAEVGKLVCKEGEKKSITCSFTH